MANPVKNSNKTSPATTPATPPATTPAAPKKREKSDNSTLVMIPFRPVQVAFLNKAAAKLGVSRSGLIRDAAVAGASQVLGENPPTVEPFTRGRSGALAGLSSEQRQAVKTAEKVAAQQARAAILAKLRA